MGLDGGHLAVVENFPHFLTTATSATSVTSAMFSQEKGRTTKLARIEEKQRRSKVTVGLAK